MTATIFCEQSIFSMCTILMLVKILFEIEQDIREEIAQENSQHSTSIFFLITNDFLSTPHFISANFFYVIFNNFQSPRKKIIENNSAIK